MKRQKVIFSARPKRLKPHLLVSPASVHYWLTTYKMSAGNENNRRAISMAHMVHMNGKNYKQIADELNRVGFLDCTGNAIV